MADKDQPAANEKDDESCCTIQRTGTLCVWSEPINRIRPNVKYTSQKHQTSVVEDIGTFSPNQLSY